MIIKAGSLTHIPLNKVAVVQRHPVSYRAGVVAVVQRHPVSYRAGVVFPCIFISSVHFCTYYISCCV